MFSISCFELIIEAISLHYWGGGCQLSKAEFTFCKKSYFVISDTDDGAGDFFLSSAFGCIPYVFVEMSLCLLFFFHVLQDPDACSVGGKTSGYRLVVWHSVAQVTLLDKQRRHRGPCCASQPTLHLIARPLNAPSPWSNCIQAVLHRIIPSGRAILQF